jgi:hypothetical protein
MRPQFKPLQHFHVLAPLLLAAFAVLILGSAPANAKEPVPASTLNKLDEQLVRVVKKSRGETTSQPDVYKFRGRVLVEIQASPSKELTDQIASLGGQVVDGWGTATIFRAWIPFAQVETLASRSDIRSISPARPTITRRLGQ